MQEREQQTKQIQRSMSASDLARIGLEEYTFKPKDKWLLHSRLRETSFEICSSI